MGEKAFTPENFESLKQTCSKISAISDLNIDGNLMGTQLNLLADFIKDFVENPIIKTSGIL